MTATRIHLTDTMAGAAAFLLCLLGPESHEFAFWSQGVCLLFIAYMQERIDERNGA